MLYREVIAVCSEIHTKHVNSLCGQNVEILGAFAKLRRANISFAVSVSPPVRPHETTRFPLDEFLVKFGICLFFEEKNLSTKIQVSLKLTRTVDTLHANWCLVIRISRQILIIKPTRCTDFSNLFLE